tara:strand:+ start:432 stop:1301 length:870 start_codon:yes stop_codon:yes gene_type:complete
MSDSTSYDYFKRKSKAEMRRELIDNGLWKDFVKAREALKENGETVERAWRMAFEAVMSPFDERFDDKEVIDYVGDVVEGNVVSEPDPEEEEEEVPDYVPPPAVVMEVMDETSRPIRPANKTKKIGSVSRRSMRKNDVGKEIFSAKTCSTPKTVEWVAANIRVGDVQAEDAPSSEAWSMLCWVKGSPQAESQFWGQIYTKLLPSRQQLEQDGKMQDDGRVVLSLISRIQQIGEDCKNDGMAQESLAGEDNGSDTDLGDAGITEPKLERHAVEGEVASAPGSQDESVDDGL